MLHIYFNIYLVSININDIKIK